MIKAVGITAEYNPLHNGHVFHMRKALELSGCEAVVAAMSGCFVQRGAPAVLDKWKRTEHALRGGADLVVEIPVFYCLGNAGQYASAGVKLLESLGAVSHISFGSESGDMDALARCACFIRDNRGRLEDVILQYSRSGLSYPAARARAYEELRKAAHLSSDRDEDEDLIKQELAILSSPNDILAVEYIMASDRAIPVPVQRRGAGYNDNVDDTCEFQSASGIRDMIASGRSAAGYVPEYAAGDLAQAAGSHGLTGTAAAIDDRDARLFDLVRYAVLTTPADIIDECPSGGEGLGNLLRSEVSRAVSLNDFILRVKSRRYTYTRISRLLMQLLLDIRRTGYPADPCYVRVLGFNDTGRAVLAETVRNDRASLPVITNINKEAAGLGSEARKCLELDVLASDIYALISGADMAAGSDHVRRPVYLTSSR